jgi:hypothetical protein
MNISIPISAARNRAGCPLKEKLPWETETTGEPLEGFILLF